MEGFTQREKDELLAYLSRIANAVEAVAKKADPNFSASTLKDLLKNPAAGFVPAKKPRWTPKTGHRWTPEKRPTK